MHNSERQRLQRRIEELQQKWNLLGEVLLKLDRERILETKPEEKLRLEHKITEIQTERQQVETELTQLEAQGAEVAQEARPTTTPQETKPPPERAQQQEPAPQPVGAAVPRRQAEPLKQVKQAHPLRTILLAVAALLLVVVVTVLWSAGGLHFPISTPTPTPTALPTAMPTPLPATPTPTAIPTPDRIAHLRSEPRTVSDNEAQQVFGLDGNSRPLKYLAHDFEAKGEIVIDHATGLMWQKAGSDTYMTFSAAQEYVKKLNAQKFAGHDDWRLPTIPELMSLLEPTKKNGDLYIDPAFDAKQRWCWSADQSSSGSAWYVDCYYGDVGWGFLDGGNYGVRGVRS